MVVSSRRALINPTSGSEIIVALLLASKSKAIDEVEVVLEP